MSCLASDLSVDDFAALSTELRKRLVLYRITRLIEPLSPPAAPEDVTPPPTESGVAGNTYKETSA